MFRTFKKKEELTQTLITKIDDYQSKITKVEAQIASPASQSIPQTAPSSGPIVNQNPPSSGPTATSAPQAAVSQRSQPNIQPQTPTLLPTSKATPTSAPANLGLIPSGSMTGGPAPAISPPPTPQNVGAAITNKKEELEKIKERAKKTVEENKKEREQKKEVNTSGEQHKDKEKKN